MGPTAEKFSEEFCNNLISGILYCMAATRKLPRITKLLSYVLGRQPDEFGLVTDADGYVKIKTLLQAMAEEQLAGVQIRRGDINELLVSSPEAAIEMEAERIRAIDRTHLPRPEVCDQWPGQLFVSIRRRAHGRVLEYGIPSPEPPGVIMSASGEMALRIGRRRDPEPVLLTVQPQALIKAGASILRYGQHLFLATALPPGTFTGPPLQKEKPQAPKAPPPAVKTEAHPGSFYLKLEPDRPRRPRRGKNEDPEWKRARREKRRPRVGKNFDDQF
jgi:putative RNA 2'-phosphotransferase